MTVNSGAGDIQYEEVVRDVVERLYPREHREKDSRPCPRSPEQREVRSLYANVLVLTSAPFHGCVLSMFFMSSLQKLS